MQTRYKHIILSTALCLWTATGWAQTTPQVKETWELKGTEPIVSDTYVARDYIKLQNNGGTTGFSFKATEGKSFSAKIDPGLLFPPNDRTYKFSDGTTSSNPTKPDPFWGNIFPMKGAVVGSIPGSASVTPTGAAAYQIPIEVPAGINGMQPQLSVAYNSQGGFGALGVGWDLAGCSAITRGSRSIYFDGQNNTIKFNDTDANTDALYWDGQRLILLSGTAFVDAEYGTEVENYARVKCTGSGFVVTTKEGKVMEYGITANSQVKNAGNASDTRVLAWKLDKVTDTYGNYMTYTYSDYGQYLTKIEYAGQSIEFGYDHVMETPKKRYIKDFLITQTKLLTTITTKSGTTKIKVFGFNYTSTSDNRLNTVSESASDNAKLKSTVINWGAESEGITSQIVAINNIDKYLGDNGGSIYSGDVNNDGYEDRIEFWAGSGSQQGHMLVRLFNSTTNQYETQCNGAIVYFAYYDPNTYKPQVIVNDIDNNGKNEIILFNGGILSTYRFSNGSISAVQSLPLMNSSHFYKNRNIKLISGDLNHDNYNDIIIVLDSYNGDGNFNAGYIIVRGSDGGIVYDGECNFTSSVLYNIPSSNNQLGDFDGDGLIDILAINSLNTGNLATDASYPIRHVTCGTFGQFNKNNINYITCDFNGDGLSDILSQSTSDFTWKLLENNGDYNITPTVKYPDIHNANNVYNDERYQSYVLDYNGDGLPDFVVGDETFKEHNGWYWLNGETDFVETNWYFYKNEGGNLILEKNITSSNRINKMYGLVSDINGDGVADLVLPITNDATSTYSYIAYTMPNATRRNQVTSIVNGMGLTDSFTYNHFSNYDQSAETNPAIRNVKSPITIVSSHTEPDESVTSYKFDKPLMHTDGKGFLGFMTVVESNMTKNREVTTEYEVNTSYFNVSLKNQTITNYNAQTISTPSLIKIISTSSQTNDVIDDVNRITQGANGQKRYIPIVLTQTNTDDFKETKQIATFDYSLYPNSVTQTTTYGYKNKTDIDLTSETVTIFTGPENKIPYLPQTVTTKQTQNGQSATRITSYGYTFDTSNAATPYKITQRIETNDPADVNQVVTTYSYDMWGHAQTISIAANGKTRSSSISYIPAGSTTSSGRFIASKTNALNETTTYNWNETLGLLSDETLTVGNKSFKTSYKYNGFGQLTETTQPDGMRKANVVQWNNDNTAQYYTYSESSGNAPTWVYYDNKGRVVRKETKGLNDNTIRVFTTYRTDGKIDKVSEPTFNTTFNPTSDPCTSYSYNPDYGYLSSVTTLMGTTSTVYDKLKTTITSPEGTTETVTNSAGQTITCTVNGKKVTYGYSYTNSCLTKTSTPVDGLAVTMNYDLQGRLIRLVDPDGGTEESQYNGFGDLLWSRQKVHDNTNYITTTNTYDDAGLGLLQSINRNGEITTYTYDTQFKSRVNSIAIANKNTQTFGYDGFNRVIKTTEDIIANGTTREYISEKTYDVYGRVKREIYPTGYNTVNVYDKYGNLTEVTDATRSIWKAVDENAKGQILHVNKGGKITTYDFDERGLPTGITADGVVKAAYSFNAKGNLEYRTDELYANNIQKEVFIGDGHDYDIQNRLTYWGVYKNGVLVKPNTITYDPVSSNITAKSDLGAFTLYYGGKNPNGSTTSRPDGSLIGPHALSSISGVPASPFPQADLTVTYTDFKKIATLHEGTKDYELTYGVDDQRRMSVYKEGGVTKLTHYYLGNYEEEVDNINNTTKKIHYLSGAILIQETGKPDKFYYSYADYQGSLIALIDESGNIQRYAYDPWGARRDPDNWAEKDSRTSWLVNRGYTGHEHLDAFGIINMNGRVYDPLTAMFFSPDPVLDANNWLSYNRYTYCFGNPFKYVDPDGEIAWFVPVIIGAVIGAYSGGVIANNGEYNPTKWDYSSGKTWGYMLGGAIVGGISGYAGWAIAGSGIPMANTAGIAGSSLINSIGTNIYTGGQTPITMSLGVASIDFTNGTFGYLGKEGNKWYEDLGYAFGALANLQDGVTLFRGGGQNVKVNSASTKDGHEWWGHSSITDEKGNTLVSVGPDSQVQKATSISATWKNSIKGADLKWDTYLKAKGTWSIELNNVSTTAISKYASNITRWDLLLNSCVGHTTRALWSAGVPVLYLFHPHMLNVQLLIRQLGIYSSSYLYQIPK
ncbi:MAG TPA: RHS repeat-associated core domain-containing protein [Paludibacter sp.]|nr:RHS repeat-associated core domain-containing protein [Paludibacter sp.]